MPRRFRYRETFGEAMLKLMGYFAAAAIVLTAFALLVMGLVKLLIAAGSKL